MKSTVILIPAYNASACLADLIRRLQYVVPESTILVVDDGSSDGTDCIAEQAHAIVIRHDKNAGKGAALQTGFKHIIQNYDAMYIMTIDADLQHLPEDAPILFETAEKTNADIVIGWRQRVGTSMPLHRRMSNALTSSMVSARTGKEIRDSQCGYRLIKKNIVEHLSLESAGFEAETEFLIKAAAKNYSITFAPIHTVYGEEKSYMTHWKTTKNFANVLFRDWL